MINNHIRLKVFVIMHYDKVFSLATISKTTGSIIDTIRIFLSAINTGYQCTAKSVHENAHKKRPKPCFERFSFF